MRWNGASEATPELGIRMERVFAGVPKSGLDLSAIAAADPQRTW
jgi:hypothetical protein